MKRSVITGILTAAAVVSLTAMAPTGARADSNRDVRNALAIVGGAAAIYGITHHDPVVAVVGTAGVIAAANCQPVVRYHVAPDCYRWHDDHRFHGRDWR